MDPYDDKYYGYQGYSNNSAFSITSGDRFNEDLGNNRFSYTFEDSHSYGGPSRSVAGSNMNSSPLYSQNNYIEGAQFGRMANSSSPFEMNQMRYSPGGLPNQNTMQSSMYGRSAGSGMIGSNHAIRAVVGGTPPGRSLSSPGTGGSNAQGRAINKMLLDILRERVVDPHRLALAIDANIERMDCVNLATLLFHTGKKRLLLTPTFIKRIAARFQILREELRAREASNALYGLKCMSSECPEVRQLVFALASKVSLSTSDLVAQAVGNALYGCQMMTSDYEEVRYLLQVLSVKVAQCTELLEAQNVGNALYGLRGMNSDFREVRMLLSALTPKVATAREDLNGQALGNSLYGLQCMSSKEIEVRNLVAVLAEKSSRCWEDLKAQEVGNALYGLKRMSSEAVEVRSLLDALVPKIASSPEILDAQAIGNSFYGMQNMKSDNPSVLNLLSVMSEKVNLSCAELDGQAMGNSLYGLQGMSSEFPEVRAVVSALTVKIQSSCLEMNAQELGNALYGLQNMNSDYPEIRRLLVAISQKVSSSKHDLTSQEIGNALYGLQGMRSDAWEVRVLVHQLASKIAKAHSLLDPQGIANSLYGLQCMSSEHEEVRVLVQALASKIEQSWKLMSAQHIAHSLFGLQNMSSFENEVAYLIRTLIPKIQSCRDEMSMKQLSFCLFGLQGMYSQNEDVRGLVKALAERALASQDSFTGSQLSAAMYGLQGMDESSSEVQLLLEALAEKSSSVQDMDLLSLGNCFYGLQRMSSDLPPLMSLLQILGDSLIAISESSTNTFTEFSSQVCSNIIYGIQNFSCSLEPVQKIVLTIAPRIADLVSSFSSKSIGVRTPRFVDILSLYQALSLSLLNLPGLDFDLNIKEILLDCQSSLFRIVESRKYEGKSMLSPSESRLVNGVAFALTKEPFIVSGGDLLYGFESVLSVKLKSNLVLSSTEGSSWSPVLNIEVIGPSHAFPAKDLFMRLRNRFLFEQHNVVVELIHINLLKSNSQQRVNVMEILIQNDHLFNELLPATSEEAANLSRQLLNQGFNSCPNGIMSTFQNLSHISLESFASNADTADDDIDDDTNTSNISFSSRIAHGLKISWIGESPKSSSPVVSPYSYPIASNNSMMSRGPVTVSNVPTLGSRGYPSSSPPVMTSNGGVGVLGLHGVQTASPVLSDDGNPQYLARSSPFGTQSGYSSRPVTVSSTSASGLGILAQTRPSPVGMERISPITHSISNMGSIGTTRGYPERHSPSTALPSRVPQSLASFSSSSFSRPVDQNIHSSTNPFNYTSAFDNGADVSITSLDTGSSLSPVEDVRDDTVEGEVYDSEIKLLEAKLEIARMEARLLQLKKGSTPPVSEVTLSQSPSLN